MNTFCNYKQLIFFPRQQKLQIFVKTTGSSRSKNLTFIYMTDFFMFQSKFCKHFTNYLHEKVAKKNNANVYKT